MINSNPAKPHEKEQKIFSLSDSEDETPKVRLKIDPGDFVYFWKAGEPNGFLGQWYTSVFRDKDGIKYTCAEQ